MKILSAITGLITYQTFGDGAKNKGKPDLNAIFQDYDEARFKAMNKKGAGIYFMFNQGDGSGRNNKSVVRIRGFFQEDDHQDQRPLPLEPHYIVETSPGKFHRHWLVNDMDQDNYKEIMGIMIRDFGSDPNAKDLARVLRVPGFINHKSDFEVRLIHESGAKPYSWDQIKFKFIDWPPVEEKVFEFTRRTIDDPSLGRNQACFMLGKELGKEGHSIELFSTTAELFIEKCRKTDPNGEETDFLYEEAVIALQSGWKSGKEERQETENSFSDERDKPLKYPILRMREFLEIPKANWFIRGVLPRADIGFIYGDSGTGKTFFALHMIKSLITGNCEFFGYKVKDPINVLYVCAEGVSGFRDRLELNLRGMEDELRLGIIPSKPNLSLRSEANEIIESCNSLKFSPDIVFVDTLAQTAGGVDENASKDMQKYLDMLQVLNSNLRCMAIVIHHSGKDTSRGMRGASCLRGAADVIFKVEGLKSNFRTVSIDKMKDGDDTAQMYFELQEEVIATGFDEDGDDLTRTSCRLIELDEKPLDLDVKLGDLEQKLVSFVSSPDYSPMSEQEVSKAVALNHDIPRISNVKRALKSLIEKGILENENGFIVLGF